MTVWLLQTTVATKNIVEQRGNDASHILTAREINLLDGVCEAAVVSKHNSVLVGILLDDKADSEYVGACAKKMILKNLGRPTKCRIYLGAEKAKSIVELSNYMATNIPKNMLEKRFDFLWNEK